MINLSCKTSTKCSYNEQSNGGKLNTRLLCNFAPDKPAWVIGGQISETCVRPPETHDKIEETETPCIPCNAYACLGEANCDPATHTLSRYTKLLTSRQHTTLDYRCSWYKNPRGTRTAATPDGRCGDSKSCPHASRNGEDSRRPRPREPGLNESTTYQRIIDERSG